MKNAHRVLVLGWVFAMKKQKAVSAFAPSPQPAHTTLSDYSIAIKNQLKFIL